MTGLNIIIMMNAVAGRMSINQFHGPKDPSLSDKGITRHLNLNKNGCHTKLRGIYNNYTVFLCFCQLYHP